MLESLLVLLVLLCIVMLIGWAAITLLTRWGAVPEVLIVTRVIIGVVCLVIIYRAITGHHFNL